MNGPAGCLLSILIPTLESRRTLCNRLCRDLEQQAERAGAAAEVEILTLRDDGSASVGAKRNELISMARGRFVVFVDDDDRVAGDYVERLVATIHTHPDTDCISFPAEITFRGKYPRLLLHSIRHEDWFYCRGQYLRPPCHIMPIRREIASRYAFAEVDYAEDMDWTLRMARDRALRREVLLDGPLYFYDSRRYYIWQWLLDRSQPLRHAMGLRFVRG